jgi:hypothetical protein
LEVPVDGLRRLAEYTRSQHAHVGAFDVICFGNTADAHDVQRVAASADAGATWWMESIFTRGSSLEATRERIRKGPPRL